MSNQILVNFEAVESGSQGMIASQSQIDDILNEMKGKLDGIKERWDGNAQAAYADAQARWDSNANDMNAILAQMGHAVSQSGQNYNETDRSAAARFQ
jgi:WXG100 family type VII secretion target